MICSTSPAMNSQNRNWNILNWNIRGLNAESKWLVVRDKIEESSCFILCIQETKMESIDAHFLKKIAPKGSTNLLISPLGVPLGYSHRLDWVPLHWKCHLLGLLRFDCCLHIQYKLRAVVSHVSLWTVSRPRGWLPLTA